MREKYKDNTEISQGYIDKFMGDASAGKVFGVSKDLVEKINERRKKN